MYIVFFSDFALDTYVIIVIRNICPIACGIVLIILVASLNFPFVYLLRNYVK